MKINLSVSANGGYFPVLAEWRENGVRYSDRFDTVYNAVNYLAGRYGRNADFRHKASGVSLLRFTEQYGKAYEMLYNAEERGETPTISISDAAALFDSSVKECAAVRGFVSLLCGYMGDYIASDREAAAFMLAWAALPTFNK